jgi:phosphate starvation-inducible PhoH-like protein
MAKAKQVKTVETEVKGNPMVVRRIVAMNPRQQEYMDALRSDSTNVIICDGYAGSSKTFLATAIACEKLKEGVIDKIYVVRSLVSDSKSVGMLKGTLQEKAYPMMQPVLDAMEQVIGVDKTRELFENGVIEPVLLEYIKGRSLSNAFVILDESEDLSIKEVVKCVSRLGKGAKLIFSGDILQCDLKKESGMVKAIELKAKYPELSWTHISFDKYEHIVRSPEVKEAIIIFQKEGIM